MNSNLAYKFNDFNKLEGVRDIKIDQQKKIHNRDSNNKKTNKTITIKLFGHKYKLRESAKKFYENLLGWIMAGVIIFTLMQMAISLY